MPLKIQIGKLAEQTGLSIDTIRFYEKQRLLKAPPRSLGGFRLFSSEDLQKLIFNKPGLSVMTAETTFTGPLVQRKLLTPGS